MKWLGKILFNELSQTFKLLHLCVTSQKQMFFALDKVYQEFYTLQWNKQAHKCIASFGGVAMILKCESYRCEGVFLICLFLFF